jgi:hypothetical protein
LKGERSFHFITLFTPSNDVLDLNIHTSPMVMRSEKAISTFNSKVCKLRMYLLNKMWWKNHYVALWQASNEVIVLP